MTTPTNLVNLEGVTARVPGDASRVLLGAVSLGIAEGDRIGVVGRNGDGKTTLLEVLTQHRRPDAGRVSQRRDLRVGVLGQRTELAPGSRIGDVVLGPLRVSATHQWAADPAVRAVLDGLGINQGSKPGSTDLDRTVDELSGGERRRVALAAALVGERDLLVLDEPTNHLDVAAVNWLAGHLLSRRAALVVVTHDRWLLDAVCTRTWEVVGGRVEGYPGGYADWIFARAERTRLTDAAEARRRNLARKELAWLRRGPPARTSKPRFRIEAAEALIANEPPPRNGVELMSFATRRLGRTVLELEDVVVERGGRRLLDGVTWRLGPGARVGLVGANGSGKTTALRVLAGELTPDAGRRVVGRTVHLAHLAQELAGVPSDGRVIEAVQEVARHVQVGRHELSASALLERLGFPAERQWTPVAELSGGELRRLQLTRLLIDGPNVLLLDEPTNDLDVDTLAQLEDLLDGWPGTLVVASHDRYLIDRVCDTVLALRGDGRLTELPGGIEQYVAELPGPQTGRSAEPAPAGGSGSNATSGAAAQRTARKEAARLERRIAALEQRESQLHIDLAAAATDGPRLLALDAQLRAVVAERTEAEQDWLAAAEAAESG